MLDRRLVTVALLLVVGCQHGPARQPASATLRNELLQMEVEDQVIREQVLPTTAEMRAAEAEAEALSKRHTRRMKQVIRRHGWPTHSLVGEEAARAAWLLVQHADHDPAFQRRVLELMAPLVTQGEVRASHYAYLWDRTHDPQRYGTQGECIARGVWTPRMIEAPQEVDARRRAVGIVPTALSDYVQLMSTLCEERHDLQSGR